MLTRLKYKLYDLLSSKSFRSFCLLALVLSLSGCGDNDEENSTTAGAEGIIAHNPCVGKHPLRTL